MNILLDDMEECYRFNDPENTVLFPGILGEWWSWTRGDRVADGERRGHYATATKNSTKNDWSSGILNFARSVMIVTVKIRQHLNGISTAWLMARHLEAQARDSPELCPYSGPSGRAPPDHH